MNRKSFDITISKKSEFDITPFGLRKAFSIYINKFSAFSLIIYGFNLVDKYRLKLKEKIVISVASHMTLTGKSTLSNIIYILGKTKVTINQIGTSVSNSIRLTFSSQNDENIATAFSHILSLIFSGKEWMGTTTTLVGRLDILFTSTLRTYRTLADLDSLTLATMDALTLSELDYTIS